MHITHLKPTQLNDSRTLHMMSHVIFILIVGALFGAKHFLSSIEIFVCVYLNSPCEHEVFFFNKLIIYIKNKK